MKYSLKLTAAVAIAAAALTSVPTVASAAEQYIPLLVYRTGSFAPLGIPWANGKQDYLKLVNERDGGVNGVKIVYDECETAYSTDKGVECYERMKNQNGGATGFDTQSTGITFAVTDRAMVDGHSVVTVGYGLSQSANGAVFKWNFPLLGTYWTAADVMIQDIAKKVGGEDKLKDKKIALVYHDSPYGKEPIQLLEARAKANGFELQLYRAVFCRRDRSVGQKPCSWRDWAPVDGDPRYGCGGCGNRDTACLCQAHGFCRQFLHHWRGRSTLGLRTPGLLGATSF